MQKLIVLLLLIITSFISISCDLPIETPISTPLSIWNKTESKWEPFAYQPPSGTKAVISRGSQIIAWTDTLETYLFDYDNSIWVNANRNIPEETIQIAFNFLDEFICLKSDDTIWINSAGTISQLPDILAPLNTIELVFSVYSGSSYLGAIIQGGSVKSFNGATTPYSWDDSLDSFPADHKELVGQLPENRVIRKQNNELYNITTASSLNIFTPANTLSTAYHSIDDTYLALH